jgi:hemerythrin-like domain-containing protein
MDEMSKGTEEWTAKLTVLREDIEHHVNEEERDLFPRAKDNLSREAQDLMASQFEEYLEDSITY